MTDRVEPALKVVVKGVRIEDRPFRDIKLPTVVVDVHLHNQLMGYVGEITLQLSDLSVARMIADAIRVGNLEVSRPENQARVK